jgi:hypothetical protein
MRVADGLGRRTVLASALALIGLGPANAFDEIDIVDLKVVDREMGRELPLWRHDGRLFVAGEQGERYSLRVTNHTAGRVLAVLSVDGVNIITGETARNDQRGYVLPPYGSYDLKGWRKSNTEVAAFAFTALADSYAALTGRPDDVGVIGMAVFRERPRPAITPLEVTPAQPERRSDLDRPSAKAGADSVVVTGSRITRRDAAAPPPPPPPPLPIPPVEKPLAPPATAPEPRDAKLGTAHGDLERSVSNVVSFVRATSYPQLLRQIEYDSRANLIRIGVIPQPRPGRPPRAFPDGSGYVPDPPARY